MTDTPLVPPPQDSPPTPVHLSPSEMYDVGGQFIAAQFDVADILQRLHADLSQFQQALGGDNSAITFADGYHQAAGQVFPGFVRLHQMIGAIGEGLTVSAENHRQADERSTPPGHPTSQPFPKRTRWDAPAIRELPPIAGDPRAWLPEPMQDVWPSYNDSKATPIVRAYVRAADELRTLFDHLYGTLRSHLENNDSDDIRALGEFFDRVAGHGENTLFTAFPNLLEALAKAVNDYCNDVSEHAHDLREAIEKAAEEMGVMLVIDAILAAFTDGLSFALVQPEEAAVLVRATPRILEIATEIAAASAAASNAAKGAADIFAMATRDTPDPNIESADAAKLADELAEPSADARTIAEHALRRHKEPGGQDHYVSGIPESQLAKYVDDVLFDKIPTDMKSLSGGRTAYWDDARKAVVIDDPAHEGTVFTPMQGKEFFDLLS